MAFLSFLGDIASSFANTQLNNSVNTSRNFRYSRRNAELDLQNSKRLFDYGFNRTTSYNDPSAVRSRMAAAGINPYASSLDSNTTGSIGAPSPTSSGFSAASQASSTLSPVDAAAARKLNAEASRIENETQSPESYTQQFQTALEGLGLSNVSTKLSNEIKAVESKFAELTRGLDTAISSAQLDNLRSEFTRTIFQTRLLQAEHRRDPLVTKQLTQALELQVLQMGLTYAQTLSTESEAFKNAAEIKNLILEGHTLQEGLKRIRMENSFLDRERSILDWDLKRQLWEIERGSTNTGYGRFTYRIHQLSSALGGLLSGNFGVSYSSGTRSSTVAKKLIK